MRTSGKDNGIFTYKPTDTWELAMISLFNLAVSGGMDGLKVDYAVVEAFSKKYELDVIDTLSLQRYLVSKISST